MTDLAKAILQHIRENPEKNELRDIMSTFGVCFIDATSALLALDAESAAWPAIAGLEAASGEARTVLNPNYRGEW